MILTLNDLTRSGWFPAVAWSLGVPTLLVALVLGSAALGERYSRIMSGASDEVRMFNRPWFIRQRSRMKWFVLALYGLQAFRSLLPAAFFPDLYVCVALLIAGWALWCLGSNRASDLPSRVYCVSLIAAAFALGLVAIFFIAPGR